MPATNTEIVTSFCMNFSLESGNAYLNNYITLYLDLSIIGEAYTGRYSVQDIYSPNIIKIQRCESKEGEAGSKFQRRRREPRAGDLEQESQ